MAGGPHAIKVPCMECLGDRKLTEARRVVEGVESDQYLCLLGHQFGMTWNEPAESPQWPAHPELIAALKGP
jgi:hypothetical protein